MSNVQNVFILTKVVIKMNDRRGEVYIVEMDAIVWPEDESLWPQTLEESITLFFTHVFTEVPTEAFE